MTGPSRADDGSIAIIGIGCRFPGGVATPADLWQLLLAGGDAIGPIPADRFVAETYYDPTPGADGKIITRQGGFLEAIDRFDAAFFGISPREAAAIDPQQRLLLEVGWEALEDAGQSVTRLANSRTGVFVGVWTSDYEDRLFQASSAVDLYTTTGGGRYAAAGRLSYCFNFQGPSLTVDTACSSSLVAVHLACQSLRTGESELALAGGANLILQPEISIGYSRSGMLAADGRCKFGDARADGYVRSEGVGLVVLKPLARALADGDPIYAVIRGTAVNNDGRTGDRLVAPGQAAQERMLRAAYAQAGVVPGAVDYVEAHGTGTRVGDVVELGALGTVLAEGRPADRPCRVGSIKTNIGHTEAASGVAGLIKAALCLRHQTIPASLHCEQPNPNVPWTSLPLAVQTTPVAWPRTDQPRLAGVNSFGVTGTNAHVVLAEAPAIKAPSVGAARPAVIVPISAQTPAALREMMTRYQALLADDAEAEPLDLAATAARRRSHQAARSALVGRDRDELRAELGPALAQPDSRHSVSQASAEMPRVLFVYSGQGSQWFGMGRRLLAEEPIFAAALREADTALRPLLGWSVLEALAATEPVVAWERTDVIQPTIFAMQVALTALWRAWGIEPAAVVGHSVGEVAAVLSAGVLTLTEAAMIVARRCQLMAETSGRGAVGIVGLPLADVAVALAEYGDGLCVASSNSPQATGVAGEVAALEELLAQFGRRGVFARRVQMDVAAHSPQMEPLVPRLRAALAHLQPRAGTLPIYSTVTGRRRAGSDFGPDYWTANLRQPVLFTQALQAALADGLTTIVEISPHPVLRTAIDETLAHLGRLATVVGSLRRGADEPVELRRALGHLYAAGHAVDWTALYPMSRPVAALPPYAWQRERHWLDNDLVPGSAGQRQGRTTGTVAPSAAADACLHTIDWVTVEAPTPLTPDQSTGRCWLILADRQGVGAALATWPAQHGDSAELLYPADLAPGADRATALRRRVEEHCQRVDRPAGPIVHLWSLDTTLPAALTAATLTAEQWLVDGSAAVVAQVLAGRRAVAPPRLVLVTRGAQCVGDQSGTPALSQSPLWGLGRVIATEQPAEWGGLLDLDPAAEAPTNAQAVWRLVGQPAGGEDQLAYRAGAWYAPRLASLTLPTSVVRPLQCRTDATYLITGGLGALGLQAAGLLAERGARRLILMSRTPLPPRHHWATLTGPDRVRERVAAVRTLEAQGVSVQLAAVDVADEAQLRDYLADYAREGWPPIRGVIHTAGLADDQLLLHHDAATWTAVQRPKVLGGWLLHSLLPELDYFVLFSSIAAVLSQPGQGSYAAANSFLDGLVAYRRSLGLSGLSINWSAWLATGLAATDGAAMSAGRLADQGVLGLTAADGVAALARLLERSPAGQVVVAPMATEVLVTAPAGQRSRLLASLVAARADGAGPTDAAAEQRAWLLAQAPMQRRPLLIERLRQQAGAILRLEPSRIDPATPLGSYGVESLAANELRVRLERALGLALSATLIWNYPTLEALAGYLLERLASETQPGPGLAPPVDRAGAAGVTEAPGAGAELDTLLEQVAELSEEEALQRLLHGS